MHLQCKTLITTKKGAEEFIPIQQEYVEIGWPIEMPDYFFPSVDCSFEVSSAGGGMNRGFFPLKAFCSSSFTCGPSLPLTTEKW
jgi:hypothetical protein